jgi:GAF domain-containing protein
MAIGCLDAESAKVEWAESRTTGLDNFARYLKSLDEKTLSPTPLHKAIAGKSFHSTRGELRSFTDMLAAEHSLRVEPADLEHIPEFAEILQPTSKVVVVPLVVSEELTGIIVVDNKFNMAPITAESESALLTFANVAGSAIENERLLNTLQRTRDAAVNVTKVSVLGNLKQSLEIIRENARRVLNCDMFTLYIYDAKANKFTGLEHYGSLDETQIRHPEELRLSSSPCKVIGLGSPNYYFTEDSLQDEFFQGDFAVNEKLKATLAIKLVFQEEPVGALFINYRSAHKFTRDEVNTTLLFADQAAIAIQNARLYSRVQQQTQTLEQLYDAGKAIAASLSLPDTLQILAERAHQLTRSEGCEQCYCNVLLEDQGLLHVAASAPQGKVFVTSPFDPRGTPCGMTGRAFFSGEPQFAGDVRQHPDYLPLDPETRSELVVPLIVGNEVIGVINVENHCLGAFEEVDKSNLELLAAQASIAIQNARAYDELRKAQGVIGARTALAWTGMSASIWRHSIEKDAITIRDQVGLLRMNLDKIPSLFGKEKVMERVDMIERLAKHILAKPITTPLSSEEGIESVLVNSLVKERVTQLWERPDYPPATYQLDFELGDEIAMLASPEWLRRALDVLVENAVREVRQCPEKNVIVGTRLSGRSQLEIYVRDTGRGVPPEIWSKLGEEIVPSSPGGESMGQGLMMAQIIVTTFGGGLMKIHTGPTGTEIGLRLPIHTAEDKQR